jgi:hypothetical protein
VPTIGEVVVIDVHQAIAGVRHAAVGDLLGKNIANGPLLLDAEFLGEPDERAGGKP